MANLRQAVDDCADHVAAMQHTCIRHSGATNEVLTSENIGALYDIECGDAATQRPRAVFVFLIRRVAAWLFLTNRAG
jgi:hypothetical protein